MTNLFTGTCQEMAHARDGIWLGKAGIMQQKIWLGRRWWPGLSPARGAGQDWQSEAHPGPALLGPFWQRHSGGHLGPILLLLDHAGDTLNHRVPCVHIPSPPPLGLFPSPYHLSNTHRWSQGLTQTWRNRLVCPHTCA